MAEQSSGNREKAINRGILEHRKGERSSSVTQSCLKKRKRRSKYMEVPERNGLMKNKLLIHMTTWMNVIDFTLNKRKLAEKIAYVLHVVPFILRPETIDTT